MSQWPQFQYTYDGSFAGFLCCVYESYVRRELPVCFAMAEDPRLTLWPDRAVETCREHAERVYRSLARRMNSIPSMAGMRMSVITISGRVSSMSSSACWPLVAFPTIWHSLASQSKSDVIPASMSGSSSTNMIRNILSSSLFSHFFLKLQRHVHRDAGETPHLALHA